MKSQRFFHIGLAMLALMLLACDPDVFERDNEPPAVPRGVSSITGDGRVTITWYPNHEADLDGYHVYRSRNANTDYFRIGTTGMPSFVDTDVVNGRTYYYAVTAFDRRGNESDLSYDLVHDTPRPAGRGVRLFDYRLYPDIAGYDFSAYRVRHYRDAATDIYFEYHQESGGFFINVFADDTDIQDYGYTSSMDDVSYAPEQGWSALGYVEAIAGHTYIIWTHDNHFAKIRLISVNSDLVEFDWAYQIDEGNPELLAAPKVSKR